jgi:hypothetical protein
MPVEPGMLENQTPQLDRFEAINTLEVNVGSSGGDGDPQRIPTQSEEASLRRRKVKAVTAMRNDVPGEEIFYPLGMRAIDLSSDDGTFVRPRQLGGVWEDSHHIT